MVTFVNINNEEVVMSEGLEILYWINMTACAGLVVALIYCRFRCDGWQ